MAGSSSPFFPDVRVSPTAREVASATALWIGGLLRRSVASAGHATLALSGGSTPKPMFADLAEQSLPWPAIHVFWVDERCVPPGNDESNYKWVNELLLKPAKVPASNIHRIMGELAPEGEAGRYASEIGEVFKLASGQLPAFDVLHRGMGPDAHTASLFPGEPLIADRTGIAAHVWVEKMQMHRITLLPGVLLKAAHTVLQAAGKDKAEPLAQVLNGPEDAFRFPCQIATRGAANAVWFVDSDAASEL